MVQQKISWRELQVEQMAYWDNAPRRGLLVFLALVSTLLLGVYFVWPKYQEWQVARVQTQALQKQYTEAALASAQSTVQRPEAQAIQPFNSSRLSLWVASLASDAQAARLQQVQIKPIFAPTQDKAVDVHSVGVLSVSAEGTYNDIVAWWANLAQTPAVLSMDNVELVGLDKNNLRGQVQIKFAQEPVP